MKKISSCIVLLFISLALLLPAYADFANLPIVDDAGYLMQSERKALAEKLDRIRKKYNFEVAIYIESEMSGYDAESSAEDIYEYNDYGAGSNADGIMLYICSDTQDYHFCTYGKGLEYFNANGLAYLESKVLPHLQENDYFEAFEAYIEYTEELLEMAKQGKPFNEKQYSTKYLIGVIVTCLLAPLLVAFFMMRKNLKKMKTAVRNNYAANYTKPGSMNIAVSRDIFLFSRITKTEKPKSSSGTHTSSSGRTYGGRGGKF